MIEIIAATYGWDTGDSDLEKIALRCLDLACDSLNAYTFEFNKTLETGLTLTSGTNYVSLSTNFWKESQAFLEHISDGKDQQPLTFYPWVPFKRQFSDDKFSGRPYAYSIFNYQHNDRVTLAPNPDASTATNFTLTVEYYARTPRFSSVNPSESPLIPQEAEPYITHYAQREFALHQYGAGHPDVASLAHVAEMDLFRLLRIDKEHPDARNRFRLVDSIPWSAAARRRIFDQWIDVNS